MVARMVRKSKGRWVVYDKYGKICIITKDKEIAEAYYDNLDS